MLFSFVLQAPHVSVISLSLSLLSLLGVAPGSISLLNEALALPSDISDRERKCVRLCVTRSVSAEGGQKPGSDIPMLFIGHSRRGH